MLMNDDEETEEKWRKSMIKDGETWYIIYKFQ